MSIPVTLPLVTAYEVISDAIRGDSPIPAKEETPEEFDKRIAEEALRWSPPTPQPNTSHS